ncbi:protein NEOXANTHIN-DEFICIENT 1 [Humulus lupulus]|uniref:protein NEOXANTHIN-DEFICIENT 1 n=1 Tax=Humulus lupulus TaxID=3486 RepID=UPI002B410A1D|nr:protein NEOXANTHIN-DEFICIENT 1 [Humulus lupulus]XP_062110707.1 protein NEOXANTHIN-DEFICIENT 1 [Humulus lupulus]
MEIGKTRNSSGFGKPPWIFKGSASYQLHLVKAETARACIPKEFRLVEAFGYTLGGFFLANYEDSPAGAFDELVVIAGLVWNPPTSCAWATKVFVNSNEACEHGRKEVGLPSHVARFSKRITAMPKKKSNKSIGFLDMIGMNTTTTTSSNSRDFMDVQVTEVKSPCVEDSCSFNLTTTLVPAASSLDKWMGPTIKMSLPSFSGRTEYTPDLFKYSCKIQCRVRAVHPTKVSVSRISELEPCSEHHESRSSSSSATTMDHSTSAAVMLSKPIFAFKFSRMTMEVEAPVVVSNCSSSNNPLRTC